MHRTLHHPRDRFYLIASSWLVAATWLGSVPRVSASEVATVQVNLVDSPVNASCRGIAAVSADEVWVTGTKGTVIHTTDAGKSWRRMTLPDTEEIDFRDVAVLPNNAVVLMSAGTGEASRVYRSGDSGKTWELVLQNRSPNGFFNGLEFDSNYRVGMLVGDPIDGRLVIYMTSDAGKTWTPLPKDKRPELNENEYGFAASGTGLALTNDYLWIVTGGSKASVWRSRRTTGSWERQATPMRAGESSSGIFSICMTDDDHGVIIGGDYQKPELDTNNVAFTNDRGKTWQRNASQMMPHKACVRSLGENRFPRCRSNRDRDHDGWR